MPTPPPSPSTDISHISHISHLGWLPINEGKNEGKALSRLRKGRSLSIPDTSSSQLKKTDEADQPAASGRKLKLHEYSTNSRNKVEASNISSPSMCKESAAILPAGSPDTCKEYCWFDQKWIDKEPHTQPAASADSSPTKPQPVKPVRESGFDEALPNASSSARPQGESTVSNWKGYSKPFSWFDPRNDHSKKDETIPDQQKPKQTGSRPDQPRWTISAKRRLKPEGYYVELPCEQKKPHPLNR